MTTNGCFGNEFRQFLLENNFSVAFSIDGDYHIESQQQQVALSQSQYDQAFNNAIALNNAGKKFQLFL